MQTLSILKPDATRRPLIGKIISHFEAAGLRVAALKMKQLGRDEAERFYAEHRERPFFASLVSFMTSAPVVLMVLEGPDAVARNRDLMGATNPAQAAPGTVRQLYGESIEANSVHGSDSEAAAAREIAFFFTPSEMT